MARRSHKVVEIDVPMAPAVIRTKFDRPDALGIFSGGISLSVIVIKGMKKPAMAMPCTMVGIMMVVNLAVGLYTPPVGTTLFITSALAKVKVGQTVRELGPFYFVAFLVLALVSYVPASILR